MCLQVMRLAGRGAESCEGKKMLTCISPGFVTILQPSHPDTIDYVKKDFDFVSIQAHLLLLPPTATLPNPVMLRRSQLWIINHQFILVGLSLGELDSYPPYYYTGVLMSASVN